MNALPNRPRMLVVLPAKSSALADASLHRWLSALQALQTMDVDVCVHAHRAVKYAVAFRPDVLVQAMHMEGAHGLDVLRQYRCTTALQCVAVWMSDVRQQGILRRRAFEYGAADVMAQPWDMLETQQKVAVWVEQQRLMHREQTLQHEWQQQTEQIARLQQQLQHASSLDALTKLPSRQSFAALYAREWQRALRETEALSLLLVDVDHFRAYNDCYGYQQGDAALQTIATLLSDMLQRPTDVCARYSGAAFMLVLPVTHAKGGILLAERIRQAIMNLHIPHAASEVADALTVSIGLVTTCPMLKHQPRDMIRMVERARFEAKHNGRNCLICKSL